MNIASPLRWLGALPPRQLALVQAVTIGVLTGLAATGFRLLMGGIGTWRNQVGLAPTTWYEWFYLPAIGFVLGAAAGHLVYRVAPESSGSGIASVQLALAQPGKAIGLRSTLVKFFGAALAIGGGISLGREAPSVYIGAGLGAWVTRWSRRAARMRRQLIAAGAGAGMAAAFQTPIAGVLFVLEGLRGDFSSRTLGPAVLAAVTAGAVAYALGGGTFAYALPPPTYHAAELPLYVLLGIAAGVAGPALTRAALWCLEASDRLAARGLGKAWHVAIVGGATGVVGLFAPPVLGGSFSLIEGALFGTLALTVLPAAILAKLAMTALAYGSGAPGGMFTPALVIGALLGLAVGQLADVLLPFTDVTTTGLAFAGMGAFFAAVARTPVTAIVIVFELTGNYTQVLPLMLAVVTANLTADALNSPSIFSAVLARAGLRLSEPGSPFAEVPVAQVMTGDLETLSATLPLGSAVGRISRSAYVLIDDAGLLVGVVTLGDVRRALDAGVAQETPLSEIGTVPCETITLDTPLAEAWRLLSVLGVGQLVVVSSVEKRQVLGLLSRAELLRASRQAS